MDEKGIKFQGSPCVEFMPWIAVSGPAWALIYLGQYYYTVWFLAIFGVISIGRLIHCRLNASPYLAIVNSDFVKVNFRKKTEKILIEDIDIVLKRWRSVKIKKNDGTSTVISADCFMDSDNINSFVSAVNDLVDQYWIKNKE